MTWLRTAFRTLFTIYALLLFVALMLVVFPFAIAASFFGRIRGGNAIYRLCCLWGDVWFPLIFIFHKNLFEQPLQKGRSYIFVANHISYLDAALIVKTFRQPLRPLGKVEMSKVPVFGFIYKNVIVTVDRSSAANRARSVQVLKAVLRKGISVLVFPEGTFNQAQQPLKEFYDGAFRIAIETGTPLRPVLFLDSYARMPYQRLFSLNPGPSRSVFLEEVPVAGYTVRDTQVLKEKVFQLMEQKLREYGASWIEAPNA